MAARHDGSRVRIAGSGGGNGFRTGVAMTGLIARLTGRGARAGTVPKAVPVVGVIRFSVLVGVQGYFRQTRDLSLDQRRAMLFAPDRMEDRFRWFEALTLPSLLAQEDGDFRVLVVHAAGLPEPWRGRLMDLLAPHPHLLPVAFEPDEFLGARIRGELARMVPRPDAPVATFRLDDDDALSSRYVGRLRALMTRYPAPQTVFGFPEGHVIQAAGDGPGFRLAERFRRPGIGCGQAFLALRDERHGVFSFGAPHTLADTRFPAVSDGREPMFLVAAHAHNDTGVSVRHQKLAESPVLGPDEVRERLGPGFAHLRLERLL